MKTNYEGYFVKYRSNNYGPFESIFSAMLYGNEKMKSEDGTLYSAAIYQGKAIVENQRLQSGSELTFLGWSNDLERQWKL